MTDETRPVATHNCEWVSLIKFAHILLRMFSGWIIGNIIFHWFQEGPCVFYWNLVQLNSFVHFYLPPHQQYVV